MMEDIELEWPKKMTRHICLHYSFNMTTSTGK